MKTLSILFLAIASTVQATTIQIDLGPVTRHSPSAEIIMPFTSGITSFNGQHLTFDITFDPDQTVLMQSKGNFEMMPMLSLTGNGTIAFPIFSAYTLGQNGLKNSDIFTGSGNTSVTTDGTETFNLILGYNFPLDEENSLSSRTDISYPFRLYGFHIDFTLPKSSDFTINGANLFLGGGGSPGFVTGNIPETGNTFLILAFSFVMLAFLRKTVCT